VEATSLHVDERGLVAELALKPHAAIAPHTNPNLAYLLVIEGGGFVRVGSETARVAAGEAVVWPPNVAHAAWTELTPMRAIVVEFAPAAEAEAAEPLLLEGGAVASGAGPSSAPTAGPVPADGALAPEPAVLPLDRRSPEEEPW